MSEARRSLLVKVMNHVSGHGLSDQSLRELAAAVGTSHRMLIYHFGSREGLLAAVVEAVEAEQREAMVDLAGEVATTADLIRRLWDRVSDPALAPNVRLFFEVLSLALQGRPGTEGFVERLTDTWLDQGARAARALDAEVSPVDVRLGVAVVRGLLIDLLASGDRAAATASLERFVALWQVADVS